MISHHMVIEGGKVANYQPYPPTPWNASVRDTYGTPGPYEDAVQNTPIFEENGPENFKGVDIMRAVRSFDPCLPCGVHMYTGVGQGPQGPAHPDRDVLSGSRLEAGRIARTGRRPEALVARFQELTGGLERIDDPLGARRSAEELVGVVLDLYGEGLRRIFAALAEDGEATARAARARSPTTASSPA